MIAQRCQSEASGETGSTDRRYDMAAAGSPFDAATDVSAGFAPGTGNAAALADDIATQIESVAIACATKGLLQSAFWAIDPIRCTATQPFLLSVRERNGS